MGNTVCTDRNLLTAEEIQAFRLKFKPTAEQLRQWEQNSAFSGFEHNIRAFQFSSKGSGSGSTPKASRSGVASEPINLAEVQQLDPTHSYVIAHLQRVPASKATPPKGYDYPQPDAECEAFAKTCDRLFSPRGISAMFSVDISALKRRSLDANQQPYVYLFKLYVYNGRKASSLVSAVAVMSAFSLEKSMLKNSDFVAAMFYNSFTGGAPAPFSTPIAPPASALSSSSSPRPTDVMSLFRDHAFLRSFYNMLSPSEQAMNNTARSVLSSTGGAGDSPSSTLRRPVIPALGQTATGGGGPLSGRMPSLNLNKVATIIPEDPNDAKPSARKPPGLPPIGGLALGGGGKLGGLGLNLAKLAEAKAPTNPDEVVPDEENPNAREERLHALKFIASEVYGRVFVGGEFAREQLTQLLEKNVSVVVNAVGTYGSGSLPNLFPKEFEYLSLQLSDDPTETIDAFFPIVNHLIDVTTNERREGVFIHCHQGVSRSASLALAYMMWREGLTFESARIRARERRNIISPNSGFIARLIMWGRHLSNPRNRVMYMYTRYNRAFPFPYCFRMVLPSATSNVIDVASTYVALEREDSSKPYSVTFFSGPECDDVIADDARDLMETLLPYAFYTGKPTTDGDVTFNPVTFDFANVREIRGDVDAFLSVAQRMLQEAGEVAEVVAGRHYPDTDLDAMLDRYQEMMEDRRVQAEGASRRKRNREARLEEERRVKEMEEDEEAAVEAPTASRAPPAMGNPFAGGGFGLKLGGLSAPVAAPPAADWNEVQVYEYPFDGDDRGRIDFIDRDDLQPDSSYAIVLIAQKPEGDSPQTDHEIILFKGSDSDVTNEELFQAYTTHFVEAEDDSPSGEGLPGTGIVISECKPTRASNVRVQMFTDETITPEFSRRLE